MVELYTTIVFGILNIALPYAVTRFDRRRLAPRELERAWNSASWASAVYFFGPLCLPAHFWVTRRSLRGLATGVAWTALILGGETLLGLAADAIFSGAAG